ncbi:hypothetical protein [Rugamonas aquatica]|uniref:Type II/III secretion system secretin-like domain-containing protein n=1 Tax=Rugamonas aquatica TaxID=2743357 RepID=A0A6A7N6S9_9BURK|nr:hypothetical protein [Rugamonas aquatica]MQA40770.1 hypothetical protein [Rugamonas aquatica]
MMRIRDKALVVGVVCALAGCAPLQLNQQRSEQLTQESRVAMQKSPATDINPVAVLDSSILPVLTVKDESSSWWLSNKRVKLLNDKRRTLNLTEVVRMFFEQGINISSSIPLDSYTYAGLGVQDMDAEMALSSILGAVGLDYELDDIAHTVLIRPMATRSWKINLGDRKTSFSARSGAGGAIASAGDTGVSAQSGQGSLGGTAQVSGQGQGQQLAGQATGQGVSAADSSGGMGGASINNNDDFWASLRAELKDRMEVLLPGVATGAAELAGQQPGVTVPAPSPLGRLAGGFTANSTNQSADFYTRKRIGTFAVNPVTGYVTVQAPRWLLNDLDKYIRRIQVENSYRITFVGEMILVTSNNSNSEGLDISSFGRFASSRYGVAFSNNALGGVTVNFPEGGAIPSITTGGQSLAGTLLGVRSPLDGLQVFNAYLQNYGTVNIVQRPILVTSNGVPGHFSRTSRKYFVQYSQVAAAGTTGAAAVGTQNQLIPFDFGTTLTINAHYDSEAQLIRAGIILDQVVQAGTQTVSQQVSTGAGTQAVGQEIPLPATFKYRGEVPLRDGDLIVIGGQSEDQSNSADAGVTGLKNGPLGAIFGQKNSTKESGTYYFALRVKLTKHE